MGSFTCKSLAEFARLFTKHQKARTRRLKKALRETAKDGVPIVKDKVPEAFGELRDSAHREGTSIVVDAPHAAASNNGSRPHRPPVEPLIAYMELRGAEDPVRAGWALANKIEAEGTPPSHFAERSVPPIREVLGARVRQALPDSNDDGGGGNDAT